ncbi:protein xmas-2 [Helicoverpa zea]|uniref:protein xmas-2 n=1 Tax=Helicoverpa zea TaxID=7113 RepID=UPI001F57E729|nr:protein xmas-2 [Helicoverpa zea]
MQSAISPRKKLKSPLQDAIINPKTSVTCSNVPDSLFDAAAAKKHFSKFGRVQKIRLFPKRHICIIEYDQPSSAERAVLNAGAYDGFMFDVTRRQARVRKRSTRKDDDPDWVPDSDVEEELSAMGGAPTYRVTRQKSMDVEPEVKTPPSKLRIPARSLKQTPLKKKLPIREKKLVIVQPAKDIEAPVAIVTTQTTLSTLEAATELNQLRTKVSLSPDEQWRILDARDRILRAWGGAGSRIKVGGATIGTCQDMCPEKELLHRQAEHQVMTLETVVDSDGELEPWRAVKQYSRSSADQEIPMCYELRPAPVLMRTCAYLLHEIADTKRQVSLADWFHFMWDRFRGIRKDITQQALCCAESICLVEMCARFHAHCAARLADLEHTQFDQKLNTDNLTKCLQTLKHMYADVGPEQKPREAEFRGYVALLNLGDANFWWEIKQLPIEIQKSAPIIFAIKVFNAIDNNNYVRFFRLVKEEATYLQACILLRYFNDVRARALARIVKAYAPRGGSRYPAEEMMNSLAFETIENLKSFINHYGLRVARTEECEGEITIILDRNHFIEDSDPYPTSRSINLIESKRKLTVGEIIAGGQLPSAEYSRHALYTSFNPDGRLKESALTAGDQGYNTLNDSNKDVQTLKAEIQRLSQGRSHVMEVRAQVPEPKANLFVKPDVLSTSPKQQQKFNAPINPIFMKPPPAFNEAKQFQFKPAIPVAPTDIIKNSPEKIEDTKNIFSFSKPQETVPPNLFTRKIENTSGPGNKILFGNLNNDKDQNSQPLFKSTKPEEPNIFKKSESSSVFGQPVQTKPSTNLFTMPKNVFSAKDEKVADPQPLFNSRNIFAGVKNDIFSKPDPTPVFEKSGNIFAKPIAPTGEDKRPTNIFGSFSKQAESNNLFTKPGNAEDQSKPKSIFANGEAATSKLSPGSLFKSAIIPPNGTDNKNYSIFQSKNKAQTVADNILNSIPPTDTPSIYEFNQNEDEEQKQAELQRLNVERMRKEEERLLQEKIRKEEEMRRIEMQRQEEERRKEEARKKQEEARRRQEELRLQEEKRRKEEQRIQEELKKKLEEEKKAELRRKAEEEQKFKERVEKESAELVEELITEINDATVKTILNEELDKFNSLMNFANTVTDEIVMNLSNEISEAELKAEIFLTRRIMKKWFYVWRKQYKRNIKRRNLLEDTPVWLTRKTPLEEASCLRRFVENAALRNMNAIHRGYKFTGELRQLPTPEPYNIMEIIRSPLLKRMKQISYPYDKCFFWKLTLVSPGGMKWLHKKVNIEKWILDVFSDKKQHEFSDTLIHVGKQSWNHLMDFAISVSLISKDKEMNGNEAIEGANALLFYASENDNDLAETIEGTLKHKYPYQIVPVAVIIPKMEFAQHRVEALLSNLAQRNIIAAYKIFIIDSQNVLEALNVSTKSAMKWLAKKFPQTPPLEIDYLKSICQRYLGNEIWCRLRLEKDNRMNVVIRDLYKLINCYNMAVDNLTKAITNEDLFNYPSFPLEFQQYLDMTSPYPKPHEFIPSSAKTADNVAAIKRIMNQLKLPNPSSEFNPVNAISMQQQMSSYCNQIGWFENPEEVLCRVVAVLPNELTDITMPREDFNRCFAQYNLLDFMNIIVYEKINRLKNFENRFAVYEKSCMEDYRSALWLYEVNVISEMKHKALEYEDDIDYYIEAKRRKIEMDSLEYLMLEDKDRTLVDETIKETDENISKYDNCAEAVKQLEKQIEEGKQKSLEFENLLKAALGDI